MHHNTFYIQFAGMRTKSLSSPSPPIPSGKTSPCPNYSGKSSPCPTIEECEHPPSSPQRTKLLSLIQSLSPDVSSGARSPIFRPLTTTDGFLAPPTIGIDQPIPIAEHNGHADEYSVMLYVEIEKLDQYCQTDLDDENLTLVQWRLKYEGPFPADSLLDIDQPLDEVTPTLDATPPFVEPESTECRSPPQIDENTMHINTTTAALNEMETQFLSAEVAAKAARSPDHIPIVVARPTIDNPTRKIVPKYSSVLNRSVSAATSSAPAQTPRVGSRPATAGVRIAAKPLAAPKLAAAPLTGPRRIDMPKGGNPRGNAVRANAAVALAAANQVSYTFVIIHLEPSIIALISSALQTHCPSSHHRLTVGRTAVPFRRSFQNHDRTAEQQKPSLHTAATLQGSLAR